MTRGLFISFEGGEGAGKTTQIQRLKARLAATGKQVVTTREPGGTSGAEAIRKLLVEGDAYNWDSTTEALLHFAARRDHVTKVIAPALEKGAIVISDRFFDSTYAYQGYGQGLDTGLIDRLRELAIGDLKPDITLVLDLPSEKGLERASVQQRYERMGLPFHERLRQGFLAMSAKEPARFHVINAAQSIESVEQAIWAVVNKRV
jgi:dTMP kinase